MSHGVAVLQNIFVAHVENGEMWDVEVHHSSSSLSACGCEISGR